MYHRMGKKRGRKIMKVYIKIRDKETGMVSERVDIEDIIYNRDVEFKFKEDETELPYNDFLFFRDDYELIIITES